MLDITTPFCIVTSEFQEFSIITTNEYLLSKYVFSPCVIGTWKRGLWQINMGCCQGVLKQKSQSGWGGVGGGCMPSQLFAEGPQHVSGRDLCISLTLTEGACCPYNMYIFLHRCHVPVLAIFAESCKGLARHTEPSTDEALSICNACQRPCHKMWGNFNRLTWNCRVVLFTRVS